MTAPPLKIILADDHEIFRAGFVSLFREGDPICIVGEAQNGLQLLHLARQLRPDVIITDIRMPGMDGIEATRLLKKEFPYMPVIALTMYCEKKDVAEMLKAGASGFMNKLVRKEDIIKAVETVMKNESYYCQQTEKMMSQLVRAGEYNASKKIIVDRFTATEKLLIHYICEQKTGKEIAKIMKINFRTLEGYRRKIMEKMSVKNQTGLAIYAVKNGLFETE